VPIAEVAVIASVEIAPAHLNDGIIIDCNLRGQAIACALIDTALILRGSDKMLHDRQRPVDRNCLD
jgi:hypothetical protein